MSDDARLTALEAKVQELEAMVTLAFRLLSLQKPVSALLASYGAVPSEDVAVHALLDDLAQRAGQGGIQTPSFGGFAEELFQRFAGIRGNREFVSLLLDALKIDRPAYRALHAFTVREGWPRWV
jgi:hypothetical protein